jgi:protein TonB
VISTSQKISPKSKIISVAPVDSSDCNELAREWKPASSHKRKPNWLLRGLIGISLGIHVVIFMHVAGIYRSSALSYIELCLHDISKPPARSIPRPRHRPKAPAPQNVTRAKVTQRLIPRFKPIKVAPPDENLPDSLAEGIDMPDITETPGPKIADWSPGKAVENAPGYSSLSYLEMVRFKIERYKQYPETAKARQIEGSVTIRFVITPEGGVRAVEVVKTSGQKVLDTVAIKAVQTAAPFPKPPGHLFKGEVPLELTIVFELT